MKRSIYMISLTLLMMGCGKLGSGGGAGGPNPQVPGVSDAPYVGKWLSDCINLGSGTINRIYKEIGTDLKVKVAVLTYAGANCTTTYTLEDENGTPVTEPQLSALLSEETVEDIPSNFFVVKTTSVTSSVSYVVMYVNDSELYELLPFNNPHDTWNQWQGEADVAQFAMNPTTYNPLTYDKIHFARSELP
jgi:hypothetical protein